MKQARDGVGIMEMFEMNNDVFLPLEAQFLSTRDTIETSAAQKQDRRSILILTQAIAMQLCPSRVCYDSSDT